MESLKWLQSCPWGRSHSTAWAFASVLQPSNPKVVRGPLVGEDRASLGGVVSAAQLEQQQMRDWERCAREESTGIEKGAGPACLNRWNNQLDTKAILRLGLLYGKQWSLLMKKPSQPIVAILPLLTQFPCVSWLTHFLHLLCLFPSSAVLAPNHINTLFKLL